MRCKNLYQLIIAIDQTIFCLVGFLLSLINPKIRVYADMTISAQAYVLYKRNTWYGKLLKEVIDDLFYICSFGKVRNHCYESYLSEKNNEHLPENI